MNALPPQLVLGPSAAAAAGARPFMDPVEGGLQTVPLSLMTINLHLFGNLALAGRDARETPLYFHDRERISPIVDYIKAKAPRYVALQEVWDPEIQHELADRLEGLYPYRLFTPWERGVSRLINAFSSVFRMDEDRVAEATDRIVRQIAQNHYHLSHSLLLKILDKVVPEDAGLWLVQKILGIQDVWGAGLLFLSQDPIDKMQSRFEPFDRKADLDLFTNKGVHKAVVLVPGIGPTTFLITHLQEGKSRKAKRARVEQLRQMRHVIDASDYPVLAAGDFNIERDLPKRPVGERRRFLRRSPEFLRMIEILRLRDAYSALGPETVTQHPGHTYLHGPFARKKGIPDSTPDQALVIDYILHDSNFGAVRVFVDDRDFYLDAARTIPLSDHRPVYVSFARRFLTSLGYPEFPDLRRPRTPAPVISA